MSAKEVHRFGPSDVSVVVCTMNSVTGIERCLLSLREAHVGEVIVVDASSTDGTREIAVAIADVLLDDPGTGLGNARNIGISHTTKPLILNMGSDNVLPEGQLQIMIDSLAELNVQGVSAQTLIEGNNYSSKGLNAWRKGRFVPGPAEVIGTPTLFDGEVLRSSPFDPSRRFSDDSELCERWARNFDAHFAISEAYFLEVGKTSWDEVKIRCRMYGISDEEVYSRGVENGWGYRRKLKSISHPLRADLITPIKRLPFAQGVSNAPFLIAFTAMRYGSWLKKASRKS
ncbi:unannotated protein [freshwater metagenome]|uniref:Unannotated protein n=1 Tax=freshwater metagenome TaxID=449393 RepID=A0A6J7GPJ7_9ZZZZ